MLLLDKGQKLAIAQKDILRLKGELAQAQEAARTIKEAVEATTLASFNKGVEETETRLAEEVAEV